MSHGSEPIFLLSTPNIDPSVWETELDRVQVVEWQPGEEYLIRLPPPSRSPSRAVKLVSLHRRTASRFFPLHLEDVMVSIE